MPCKCCVPRCRGNYTGDTKVHVFKFPRDQALRDAWIHAVPRENLTVTEHSRVCELHFMDEDIIRDATHTDQATVRVMKVPLSHVRLRPDAVPSKFPNHSSYLSRKTARREDPDSKRARIENAALQKAIAESNDAFIRAREEDKVNSVSELANHLRSQGMKFWDVIERNERLLLIHIVDDEAPWLKYSVCVKGDLSVTLHVMKTAVKKLGANLCVPEIANSKRGMVELLEGIEKWDCDLMSNSVAEICEAVCLLLDQLCTSQAEDDANCIQFLKEQVTLHLSKKQRRRYSADFMMFCCMVFSISPHAYAFVRSHGSITLPHPMTIRSVCSSYDPVHILKCIRNNWINQKNDQICFYFPEIQGDTPESERMQTAPFATIRDLHSKECDQLLKYGYGLSRKALYPSSLERQDVKLALQIFNDYLPEALRALGAKHNLFSFEATATFVEIILKWWKIHWECVRKQVEALLPSSNVVVTSQALTKMQDVVPVLVYVAGYAVYGTLKKLKCEQCRDSLTVDKKITVSATNEHYGLVKQLDRGGLVYPSMFALNAVAHSYVVVEPLATEPALLMIPEQRQVVTKMTLQLLASEEQSDFDTCENGHTVELVLKHILRCSTNILPKNFCRKLNDKLLEAADKSKKGNPQLSRPNNCMHCF
ncbi:hypothetical protein HPB49_009731 [Dermacentor silvarum]|uniref:Uncharacterized protein n=1 Tax=Dermacentor silvarum TaxID=543639 RepID=A0ACB8CWL6_DERSI|nr:hypothetical protein HPB49_009731 [Dermacentor silvarum]